MNRETTLDTAKSLVCGERAKQYAPPKKNFQRIANMWTEILGVKVIPEQVALCMSAIKITRLIENPKHEDSWIDLAGYAACGAEVAEVEKVQGPFPGQFHEVKGVADFNFWGVGHG